MKSWVAVATHDFVAEFQAPSFDSLPRAGAERRGII
jgi:hypothetical protein